MQRFAACERFLFKPTKTYAMKTFQMTLLALVSLFFFFACTPDDEPAPATNTCDALLIGRNSFLTAPRDAFRFKSALVDTNCLELVVNYGGGCGIANFDLIYIGTLNNSMPPVASMVLSFDDQDACEAALDTTLRFSLFGLRDTNYSEIVLDIEGYTPASQLVYKYE